LLEELVERTRLSPLQLTVVVELALITILAGTAYLDGVLAHPFENARTGDGALLDSINAWTAHEEWVRKLVAVTVTIGLQYPGHGNTPLSCNADTGPSEVREAGHFRTLAENATEPTRTNGR
jgi:hypothetical protein